MLEIFIVTLLISITTLGSVLSIFGLRETAVMFKKCLDAALDILGNIARDIYESIAAGEILTLLLLLLF